MNFCKSVVVHYRNRKRPFRGAQDFGQFPVQNPDKADYAPRLEIGDLENFTIKKLIVDGSEKAYPPDGNLPAFEFFALVELAKK